MGAKSPTLTIRWLQTTPVELCARNQPGTRHRGAFCFLTWNPKRQFTRRSYSQFSNLPAPAPAIARLLENIEGLVKGWSVSSVELWRHLAAHFTLSGVQGTVRMAMAALDVVAPDALAIVAGVPLAHFLGGDIKPVRAHNSCGRG